MAYYSIEYEYKSRDYSKSNKMVHGGFVYVKPNFAATNFVRWLETGKVKSTYRI